MREFLGSLVIRPALGKDGASDAPGRTVKKSVVAVSRFRSLLVGLAIGAALVLVGGSGCVLGPKQDDPDRLGGDIVA